MIEYVVGGVIGILLFLSIALASSKLNEWKYRRDYAKLIEEKKING